MGIEVFPPSGAVSTPSSGSNLLINGSFNINQRENTTNMGMMRREQLVWSNG